MMARRGILGLLAGGATFLLTGCRVLADPSYRFKMTVEVDTPQGLKAGSSVYDVKVIRSTDLMTDSPASEAVVRGEAVMVDLPGGLKLFALLRTVNQLNNDLATMSMVALDPNFDFKRADSSNRIARGGPTGSPAEVPSDYYPILVTFRDVGDPTSVELFDPQNLSATVGSGARLTRVTVAVTDEAVVEKLHSYLPWLKKIGRDRGTLIPNPPRLLKDSTVIQRVSASDFSTELFK